MKKVLLIFYCLLMSFCGNNCLDAKKELYECVLVGELTHIQRWDANDSWNIKSLNVEAKYCDGTSQLLDVSNKSCSFIFAPESPNGLDHSINSFAVSGTVKQGKNKVQIQERVFDGISIIDCPYQEKGNNLSLVIIFATCSIIAFLVLFSFITKNKKERI